MGIESHLHVAPVPESALDKDSEGCVLGIDEAGRGCVLGPMVYGAAYWSLAHDEELSKMGFDDSKDLTAEKREALFAEMKANNHVGWAIRALSASEISHHMLAKWPVSLNKMSHDAAIELIKAVQAKGVRVARVYVDTVGPPDSYRALLEREFRSDDDGEPIQFTVEKKADKLYKTVSAASIAAKVSRDQALEQWGEGEDVDRDFGCGYPSDPKCAQWMKRNVQPVFGYPDLVRHSWSTVTEALKPQAVRVEWEEDEEEGGLPAGTQKLDGFLTGGGGGPAKKRRTNWYRRAGLELVTNF
ncbi:unnamed protein product [Chrysoparadoxa australica]